MRILHLIPNLSGGGAEKQLCYLAMGMAGLNHEVHIAFFQEGYHKPEIPGVIFHKLSSRSNYNPFILIKIARLVRRIKPDVIQTWILQMDIFGGLVAQLLNVNWILREPSSKTHYQRSWKNSLRYKLGKKAAAIVSNSKGGDEYWKSQVGSNKRVIIPNAIPVAQIENAVSQWGADLFGTHPTLLFAGRFNANQAGNKNLDTLLTSFREVNKQIRVNLILCGDGPQKEDLQEAIAKMSLTDQVTFTGFLDAGHIWSLMKKADAFISLSDYEGFPNAVMEAMCCKCPLIVSDIDAHREFLDQDLAFLVDQKKVPEVVGAIIRLLANPSMAQDMANRARFKAQHWTVDRMTKDYINLYTSVINN